MNYLIAVLADRIQAEEAAVALEKAGIPQSQVTILGRGYKSADEFGLIDPFQQAKKRATLMAFWLIPFGFAGGYLFNLITGLHTFDWAGEPGNHIVGGIAGAMGGAMGSIFVGGGVGLSSGSGDALPYRNRQGSRQVSVYFRHFMFSNTIETTKALQDMPQYAPRHKHQ
ncbi:MAG: hypothetical protein ACKO7A_28040 [Microcystis sp.]